MCIYIYIYIHTHTHACTYAWFCLYFLYLTMPVSSWSLAAGAEPTVSGPIPCAAFRPRAPSENEISVREFRTKAYLTGENIARMAVNSYVTLSLAAGVELTVSACFARGGRRRKRDTSSEPIDIVRPAAVRCEMVLHQAFRARRVRTKTAAAVRCDMVLHRAFRARHV